jgi:putative transposon-encoded protein
MSYCFFVDVLVHGWEECTCFRRRCVIGRGEERGCLRESWNTLAVIDLVQELEHCAVVIRIVLPGHKAPFGAEARLPKHYVWCRSPTFGAEARLLVPKPDSQSTTFGAEARLLVPKPDSRSMLPLVPKPDSQSTTFGAEARLLVPKPDYLRHRIASRLRMICEVTWSDQLSRVGQAT